MSLFKTEELWSVKCSQGEKFNLSTICVGNFTNKEYLSDQIVVGSLNGTIKLYGPLNNATNDDTNPFLFGKCDDLLYEINIKSNIIEILTGKYCGEDKMYLAILCPKKLCYFAVEDDLSGLRVIEEYKLERTAYNMCSGKFGNPSGSKDYICVQSTDCTLSIFTSGYLAITCYLAESILPGPIRYLLDDDSFLCVSPTSRYLLAYKYKNMARVTTSLSAPSQTQKRTADWNLNIGDSAVDLLVVNTEVKGTLLLILARFAVYIIVNSTGDILKKRFEVSCRAIHYYHVTENGDPQYIITNTLGEILIFRGTTLIWKAILATPNVINITTGCFNGLQRFLVGINEDGDLFINFLGTDPQTNSVALPVMRGEQISEDKEAELQVLQSKIQNVSEKQTPISIKSKENTKSFIKINIDVSTAKLEKSYDEDKQCQIVKYHVNFKVRSEINAQNLCIRISVPKPIDVSDTLFQCPTILPDKEMIFPLTFSCSSAMVARTLAVRIIGTYELINEQIVKVTQSSFTLPMSIILEAHSPVKQAKFKITLDSKMDEMVGLSKLFPEFVEKTTESSDVNQQQSDVALGFQYYNDGPIITILASVNSRKYRIQSDHFEAMYIIIRELLSRLTSRYGPISVLGYSSPLPLDFYYLILDSHFAIRKNFVKFSNTLEEKCKQFRAIEKMLLRKTKDKSVTNLQNYDLLVESSINQIVQLSDICSEQQSHLLIVGNALSASTAMLGLLIQLSVGEENPLLKAAFSDNYIDFINLGLEEIYEQIFVYMIKVLTKTSHKQEIQLSVPDLNFSDNIDQLKKHIRLLCEKATKSGNPNSNIRLDTVEEDAAESAEKLNIPDMFSFSPHEKKKKHKQKKGDHKSIGKINTEI